MKNTLSLLSVIFLPMLSGEIFAQSKAPAQTDKNFPTSLQPVNPVQHYGPKKAKKTKKKAVTYDAQNDYYNRVENTWKEREKREKSYERGGSVDIMKPPYFGHKKPPKIRPIEKRKYCKICGIRH